MAQSHIIHLTIISFIIWINLNTSLAEKENILLRSILPRSDKAESENAQGTAEDSRAFAANKNYCGGRVRRQTANVNADVYLEKYGYLSHLQVGESHDVSSRKKAIKEFQRMAGITETGCLDVDTAYWMQQPRCGMPDRTPLDMNITESSILAASRGAPEGYYVPGYKWSKDSLTWKVERYSGDLSVESQRRAMYNAFKHWSDVTPLTFNEISGNDADIAIGFASYEHGDGYGNSFDGQGGTLAHAFYPESGDTHFDESEEWTEYTDRGTNLEIVAAHEFGHALGLGHSDADGALMRPFYQGYVPNFKLGYDDIMGLQSLYGPRELPPQPTTPRPTERPSSPHPRPTEPGYTARPTQPSVQPDACTMRYDAVFQASDGHIYILKHMWAWKLHYWGMYPGYPVPLTDLFEQAPQNIRAAAHSFRSGYTYLFKGLYVYKYYGSRKISKKLIRMDGYAPPQSALMAADGIIYLLRGRYYWIFNENSLTVETGIKRRIRDRWPGLPDNIDAAVRLNDAYIYVFKGARYRKFDERDNIMVSGYPKQKAGPWMGPACTNDGSYIRK